LEPADNVFLTREIVFWEWWGCSRIAPWIRQWWG